MYLSVHGIEPGTLPPLLSLSPLYHLGPHFVFHFLLVNFFSALGLFVSPSNHPHPCPSGERVTPSLLQVWSTRQQHHGGRGAVRVGCQECRVSGPALILLAQRPWPRLSRITTDAHPQGHRSLRSCRCFPSCSQLCRQRIFPTP